MSDAIEIVTDTPDQDTGPTILEHLKTYSDQGKVAKADAEVEASRTPEPTAEEREAAVELERTRDDKGKFQPERLKPKDAVARINQLTGRAKAAEERLQAAEAELQRLKNERATPTQIATAEAKVERAETQVAQVSPTTFTEPEPQEEDPQFEGDYGKFLRSLAKWEARRENHEQRQLAIKQQQEWQQQQQRETAERSFAERMAATEPKYPDFRDVLTTQPAIWLDARGNVTPQGALIDAYIREDVDSGPDVLYHLLKNPTEADALMRMEPILQVKRLALLAERFGASSSSGERAGTTGAAPRRVVTPPPKPPTPVRTEAQSAKTPPPLDGSLSVVGHLRAFHKR